jgi:hypothetical protein
MDEALPGASPDLEARDLLCDSAPKLVKHALTVALKFERLGGRTVR